MGWGGVGAVGAVWGKARPRLESRKVYSTGWGTRKSQEENKGEARN
jgi:hypothetical protein